LIRDLLHAIDRHNGLYFATGDRWHLERAQDLRQYVISLKDWIRRHE
jgi:hypothetical protein